MVQSIPDSCSPFSISRNPGDARHYLSLSRVAGKRACADSGMRQQSQELTSDTTSAAGHEHHKCLLSFNVRLLDEFRRQVFDHPVLLRLESGSTGLRGRR